MVDVCQLIPIHAESTVVNHYHHQKTELHFDRKSDSDFIMFLLDTAVRVISVAKYLVPVIEAISDPVIDPILEGVSELVIDPVLEEEESDKNPVLTQSQSDLLDSLGLSRSDIILPEMEVVGSNVVKEGHPETMSESLRTRSLSETELEQQTNIVNESISQLQVNLEALSKDKLPELSLEEPFVKLERKLISEKAAVNKHGPGMALEAPVIKLEPWVDDDTRVEVCSDVENEPNITSNITQTSNPDSNDMTRASLDDAGPDNKLQCCFCNEIFTTLVQLRLHESNHTGLGHVQCHICHRLISKTYFKEHLAIHLENKVWHCNFCYKKFALKSYLRNHIMSIHSVKKFKCAVCDKRFAQNNLLKKHMVCHSDVKLFHCEVCQKKFLRKGLLTRHMFLHTGGIQCEFCLKRFTRKDTLVNHRRSTCKERKRILK